MSSKWQASQNSPPMVSVVVPAYNHEKYVAECLENILAQKTNFNFEIIIGEDDSNDNTRKICMDYSARFPEKIVLRLQDRKNVIYINGMPTGRYNLMDCMANAKGKYVAFCEGDDYWCDTSKLQKQYDFLENNPGFAGSFHDTWVEYPDKKKEKHLFRENLPLVITAKDTIAKIAPFHTSSFFFKKETLPMPPFIKEIVSGDLAYFSIVSSYGDLGKVNGIMSVYRKHTAGISSSVGVTSNYHRQRITLINYLNEFHGFRFQEKTNEVLAHHQRNIDGVTTIKPKRSAVKNIFSRLKSIFFHEKR
ncbi:MAG: glycosyltransferase family 2 protein [Crocinitomicaceae bacterium]|nr:glycosyltransferase family 2 protein [Crocinitomicaceae bacterium]